MNELADLNDFFVNNYLGLDNDKRKLLDKAFYQASELNFSFIKHITNDILEMEDDNIILEVGHKYAEDRDGITNESIQTFLYKGYQFNYMALENFETSSISKFKNSINRLQFDLPLVIDLKGNDRGSIAAVNEMLNIFIPKNYLYSVLKGNGRVQVYYSTEEYTKLNKVFILVDHDTSNMAELFAMSLKKNLEDVTILGTKTRGLNYTQEMYYDSSNNVTLYLPTGKWFFEASNQVSLPIKPDITVNKQGLNSFVEHIMTHNNIH